MTNRFARSLKYHFIAMFLPMFIVIFTLTFVAFDHFVNNITYELTERLAKSTAEFDSQKAIEPLIREMDLAKILAKSPILSVWASNETDPKARFFALKELDRFRESFTDKGYFFVVNESGNYYSSNSPFDPNNIPLKRSMSVDIPSDTWFFSVKSLGERCNINVDDDNVNFKVEDRVIKVWVNCLVHHDDKLVGIVGTGTEITQFIQSVVNTVTPGVTSIFIDESGAIMAHPDNKLIDVDSLSKRDEAKSKIFELIDIPSAKEKLAATMYKLKSRQAPSEVISLSWSGMDTLLGVSYIPQLKWFSVSVINPDQLWFKKYFYPLVILMALGVIATIAAMLFTLNHLVLSRIEILDSQVTDFKSSPTSQLESNQQLRNDEISRLYSNFSEMAKSVQDNTLMLEQVVKTRTKELEKLATTDSLTGIANRRMFEQTLTSEIHRVSRFGDHLSLVLFDIDHFKVANDTHGHDIGDIVLKSISTFVYQEIREVDLLARFGGDEFVIIMPQTDESSALRFAERIRKDIATINLVQAVGQDFKVTVSMGVATYTEQANSVELMLKQADLALYQAKNAGRNCSVRASKISTQPN